MEERRKNHLGSGERRKADAERIADALKRRGRTAIHVRGTSMLPLVRPGDVALIRRDKLENMRAGDVVLMQRGEQLIAKRIGEDGDSGGAEILGLGEVVGGDGDGQDVSGGQKVAQRQREQLREQQECLGKIVRVRREKEKIDLGARITATEGGASEVFGPER
jgi:Peptidase S24-like